MSDNRCPHCGEDLRGIVGMVESHGGDGVFPLVGLPQSSSERLTVEAWLILEDQREAGRVAGGKQVDPLTRAEAVLTAFFLVLVAGNPWQDQGGVPLGADLFAEGSIAQVEVKDHIIAELTRLGFVAEARNPWRGGRCGGFSDKSHWIIDVRNPHKNRLPHENR